MCRRNTPRYQERKRALPLVRLLPGRCSFTPRNPVTNPSESCNAGSTQPITILREVIPQTPHQTCSQTPQSPYLSHYFTLYSETLAGGKAGAFGGAAGFGCSAVGVACLVGLVVLSCICVWVLVSALF